MTFSLRSTIVLISLFALIFAVYVRSPPLGLAAASFVPLITIAILRPRRRALASVRACRILAAGIAIMPVYVASIGPYVMAKAYYAFVPAPRPLQVMLDHGDSVYDPMFTAFKESFTIAKATVTVAPTPHLSRQILDSDETDPIRWYAREWRNYGEQPGLDRYKDHFFSTTFLTNERIDDPCEPEVAMTRLQMDATMGDLGLPCRSARD